MADKELRYGISALSTEYMSYAEDDELLVRNPDGKMFYKRPDGLVVSYDTRDYDKSSLINAMNGAVERAGESYISLADNDSILYSKIDISGLTDILSTSKVTFTGAYDFPVSPNEPGMFIRVRGADTVNGIMDYVKSHYLSKGPDYLGYSLTINIKITSSDDTNTVIEAKGSLNELIFAKFTIDNVVSAKITAITFSYADMYNALPASNRSRLVKLNDNNSKYEATTLDVITYSEDLSSVTIKDDENKITLVQAIIDPIAETASNQVGIVLSVDKPTFPCLWGKIIEPI